MIDIYCIFSFIIDVVSVGLVVVVVVVVVFVEVTTGGIVFFFLFDIHHKWNGSIFEACV